MFKALHRTALLAALAIVIAWLTGCASAPDAMPRAVEPADAGLTLVGGRVVLPDRVLEDGWIVISGGRIVSVHDALPRVRVQRTLATRDFVFPGLIDLHNHPTYNTVPRWKPARAASNRYEWRDDPAHDAAVFRPAAAAARADFCAVDAFVEVKALVGGTTAISGLSNPGGAPMPDCIVGLARNLDWHSGLRGTRVGSERIRNLLGVLPRDQRGVDVAEVAARLRRGELDLVTVHLAEGRRGDSQSRAEFELLESQGLLTARTAIVHGTALGADEFRRMAIAGTALLWSPRSNDELYGETTDVLEALRAGVTVALSPDWSPTGSHSLLEELAYANALSRERLGGALSARQLFEMATAIPARLARLEADLGAIAPGRAADLLVLRSAKADPYEAIVSAAADAPTLVMVGGVAHYGEPGNLAALGVREVEGVEICGARKGLNGAALPAGSFASVRERLARLLRAEGAELAALAECAR
jgi:5-methylthioadenosine/S-adenosylhomocysteine deaminase